jgi:uncharacterized protein YjbI with pentapeptide repeats
MNFSHARMPESNFSEFRRERILLRSANVKDSRLYEARLTSSDLTNTNLYASDLNQSVIADCCFAECNLDECNFLRTRFHFCRFTASKRDAGPFRPGKQPGAARIPAITLIPGLQTGIWAGFP